jgi:hypothetical protein
MCQVAQTIDLSREVGATSGRVSRRVDVSVSAPVRYVKVVLYDYSSDRVGSTTIDLQSRSR